MHPWFRKWAAGDRCGSIEVTTSGRKLGGEGGDADSPKASTSEAPKTPKASRGGEWNGEGVSPFLTDYEVWGASWAPSAGSGAESLPKTDFSTFQASQNASHLDVFCKLTSCQKALLVQKMGGSCWQVRPEGTAAGWGLGGEGLNAEGISVRGAEPSPNRLRSLGVRVGSGKNGFSAYQASQNDSRWDVCRKLTVSFTVSEM